jgi:hypothetical protein
MTPEEAYEVVTSNLSYHPGTFYGSAYGITLGAGLLYSNVRQPAIDKTSLLYKTIRAFAYVITHECDVAQSNDRPLNDAVLICPLIRFEDFVEEFKSLPNLPAFLGMLATRGVFRALYIPTTDGMPYGAILYLNRIASTDVTAFNEPGVECIGAVSTIGLREIDAALSNLLMREKADRLTAPATNLSGTSFQN